MSTLTQTQQLHAKGGGVYLQQNSKLYLLKDDLEELDQLYYVINNNSAEYGGGIFVANDTDTCSAAIDSHYFC